MKDINLEKNLVIIDKIALDNADIQLIKRKNQTGFSFDFIIDYFSGEKDTTTSNTNLFVKANHIELKNSRFRYKDFRSTASFYGMDYNDIDAKSVNLTFSDFKSIGSNIKVKIEHLSSIEKSEFNLQNFTGNVELDTNFIFIDSLQITTPYSKILTKSFRFDFESLSDFEYDFENKVKMTADFQKTSLNLKDLSYYTSFFEGIDRVVLFSGKFEGTVADFKTRNINLKIDKNTVFKGNLSMKGLPYEDNTYFHLAVNKLISNEQELKNIDIPPFENNQKINLPQEFNGIGNILISGSMKGKFSDFNSDLTIQTKQGNIVTNSRYWENGNSIYLDGTIAAQDLNAGHFLKDNNLKLVNAKTVTKLRWNTKNGIEISTKGKILSLVYNDFTYKNIDVDGDFTEKSFNGKAALKGENGDAIFNGAINFEGEKAIYDFKTSLIKVNLTKLNLIKDTIDHILTAEIKIEGSEIDIEKTTGTATIKNLTYQQGDNSYFSKEITINSSLVDSTKEIKLYSDMLNATMKGNFLIFEIPKTFDIIGQQVVPALYSSIDIISVEKQNYELDVLIKNYTPLQQLFTPTFHIAKNTIASVKFTSLGEDFNFYCESDSIVYASNKFEKVHIKLEKPSEALDLTVLVEKAKLGTDLTLDQLELNSMIKEDHIMPTIKWNSNDGESYGKIQGDGYWYSETYFDLILLPSYIHYKERDWKILEDAAFIVDSTAIEVNDVGLINNLGESVSLLGKISENPKDSLTIAINNFKVNNLNPFIGKATQKYYGLINGNASVKNMYNQIEIVSDMKIDSLQVNQEMIGDIAFKSDWLNSIKAMDIKGKLLREETKTFDFNGNFFPFKKKNSLDFNCILNNTNLAFLNPFVSDQGLSEIEGNAKGNLTIKGEPEQPLINGKITLEKTGFLLDYLNTRYYFSGLLIIENDGINTDNIIEIRDEENNLAYFNGSVLHNNYSDFDVNINIELPNTVYRKGLRREIYNFEDSKEVPNKFIGINTNEELNSDFFGKVYATGDISISGHQDELNIEVNVKTEKGSNFTLPLYGTSEVEIEDYIVFVDSNSALKEIENIDLEGINLDMNVEVTPDVKVQLIFDQVYGDIITGVGSGNLSMTVDKNNEFNLAGKYEIKKGDYLFTLGLKQFENLINKRFEIAEGGTINWFGDPYNAEINLTAIYKLKASMYDVIPKISADNSKYKQRREVECQMLLTNNLFSPDINFSIELPRADETERAVIANLMETQQELNKQVFSLLLLNRFSPSANSINEQDREGSSAVSSTASEILSNQLSNWLSKLSNNVEIGLNYSPGDNITSDEIAVALSTELFNERVVISSNLGVSQGNKVNNNQDALIGNVNVEYKINKDGTFRIKVFTRTNEYDITNTNQSQTKSGVGIYHKKEFNTWKEFIRRKKN